MGIGLLCQRLETLGFSPGSMSFNHLRRERKMTNKEKIIDLIFIAVDELNQRLSHQQKLEKSVDTVLFGKYAKLDSLGLVGLIVSIEEKIEEEFEVTITLADERAMSQKNSPFKTIGTLADYVSLLLEEETNG
jgi:acyl carrier protein